METAHTPTLFHKILHVATINLLALCNVLNVYVKNLRNE